MAFEKGDSIRPMNEGFKRFNTAGSRRSLGIEESPGPSIPSRFQTLVSDNSEKPGFASRSKRFDDLRYVTDAPGPGAYSGIDKKVVCGSVSASKRGSGTFASKSRRKDIFTPQYTTPGPGSYLGPNAQPGRADFSQSAASSSLAKPIAEKIERFDDGPGPNSYNVARSLSDIPGGAQGAFKSRTKREGIFKTSNTVVPSPDKYNVRDDYTQPNVHVPVSSFKSKVNREFLSKNETAPPPGHYEPYKKFDLTSVKRLKMPNKHYLCISAPAMPLPKKGPWPGPGAYDLPTAFPTSDSYVQSASFLSSTTRGGPSIAPGGTPSGVPGPATYKPMVGGKQSFFYNSRSIWAS